MIVDRDRIDHYGDDVRVTRGTIANFTGENNFMDFKVFDRARRNASPLELDLVESYAQGHISRRNFVKRGAVLGLSVPFMGSIIAACGSDEAEDTSETTATTATTAAGSTDTTAASTGSTTAPAAWTGSCPGSATLGIVDYGHRSVPDIYLNAALSSAGIWNSSHYSSPEFDAAFTAYQSSIGVEAQKVACALIQQILNEDVPVIIPYFYNYLSGSNKTVSGVRVSALGQMFLDGASGVDVIKVASQKPAGPLDPVAMQDLGSYGVVGQCFEYLAGLGEGTDIGPSLAESWEPNEDGSVWTFTLRSGVTWQDGSDFTSADVAATMDRLVEAGNSGLKGVIKVGAVDTTSPDIAVFTLESPNGNFPYLVSLYNSQSCITPTSYETGTTLDASPNGTGPFRLDSFDAATGASFVVNPDWWGSAPSISGSEWVFFEDIGAMVTATAAGEVDTIVQFQVIGGDALFNDEDFTVLGFQATTHRQIWMRCDEGPFADKRVRQALALTIPRQQLVDTLFKGQGDIGNDHPISPVYPFFAPDAVAQREQDLVKAKALLAEAGAEGLEVTLVTPDLQEIPQLAELIQAGANEAGFKLTIEVESLDTFYSASWCPEG